MSSVTAADLPNRTAFAAPMDAPLVGRRQTECQSDTIYRRGLADIIWVPVVLVMLMLALAIFENFRNGSILPVEEAVLYILGPFLVTSSLLWSLVIWYGNYICVNEESLSIHEMNLFFESGTNSLSWADVNNVFFKRKYYTDSIVVVLLSSADENIFIDRVPGSKRLYRHILAHLNRASSL